jgi:hypothetical protein
MARGWSARALLCAVVLGAAGLTAAAPPTVVVTAPAHANPTNVFPIDLVVTFSEKVTGFGDTGIPSELQFTGG